MSKNLMGLLMVPVLTAGFIVVAFVLMQVSASPEETLLVDASQVEIVSPRPTMSESPTQSWPEIVAEEREAQWPAPIRCTTRYVSPTSVGVGIDGTNVSGAGEVGV